MVVDSIIIIIMRMKMKMIMTMLMIGQIQKHTCGVIVKHTTYMILVEGIWGISIRGRYAILAFQGKEKTKGVAFIPLYPSQIRVNSMFLVKS